MAGGWHGILANLPAVFAVATLPLAILALLFFGPLEAVAVIVVGWLLLTPLAAVLAPDPIGDAVSDAVEAHVRSELEASLEGNARNSTASGTHYERRRASDHGDAHSDRDDPIDVLRERYARGELDDAEFERALEALVGSEDGDAELALEILRENQNRNQNQNRNRDPNPESVDDLVERESALDHDETEPDGEFEGKLE